MNPGGGKITPVDFSTGHYVFGRYGKDIRLAMVAKITSLQEAASLLLATIEREIGEDSRQITGLLVSLFSEKRSVKATYIKSLCERYLALEEETAELSRMVKHMNDDMLYLLSPTELAKFGL